jgi:outer membrane protein assembly factor BamB
MRTCTLLGLAASVALVGVVPSSGADWPGWGGPDRTNVSKEKGLLAKWPKDGPKLAWTFKKAGQGYSSFAVVGGVLYTMGCRDQDEYVIAIDDKGKEKWATKIAKVFDFKGNQWSRGPNGAPSVAGDLVFALGSQGELVALKKADGTVAWRKNLPKELAAEVNPVGGGPAKMGWGYSWSPLVDGERLICVPGGPKGLFAALEAKSGKVLWRSTDVPDQATYSSPVVTTVGGVRQYVQVVQDGAVGVSAKDGALLWRYKRAGDYDDVVCPTPICHGDHVYVSVGYNGGGVLLKLAPDGKKFKASPVYEEREIGNKQGGVVRIGKHVYGYNEDRAWVCQELATGKVKWGNKRPPRTALKAGAITAADNKIFIQEDTGVVGMIAASPKGYEELGRFKLPEESNLRKPSGKVWTYPVVADGKLYLRDQEYIFCYEVK